MLAATLIAGIPFWEECLLVILAVGFLCWVVRLLPIAEPFQQIFQGVCILLLVIYLVSHFLR